MDVKFISQDNEVQKLYAKFGMVVPVGDLSTGKAPAIQPLPSTSTQSSVTAQFNVMSGADISALSYTVNDGEAVSITPAKGVVTITLTDLEHNSGPYEIEITAVNENGSTSASVETDLVHYTNWATADEVLDGNKFIGEDGQEAVGTYVPESGPTDGGAVIQACEYIEHIQSEPDAPSGIKVTFSSSLPTEEGHTYYTQLFVETYSYDLPEPDYVYVPVFYLGIGNVELNYIQDGAEVNDFDLIDSEGNPLQEAPAKLYVYEDNFMQDPKWIVPCTYVNQTVQQ